MTRALSTVSGAIIAFAALTLVAEVVVYSDLTWEKRQYERKLRDRVKATDGFADIGVILKVVCADERRGTELIPGKPKLRVLHEDRAGFVIDTRARKVIGESSFERVWYCSEQQYPIIRHRDRLPLGLHVCGSEGSGKTSVLPRWVFFRWLEALFEGREGGIVAPTNRRLRAFLRDFRATFPSSWFSYIKSENLITLCDGTRLQMVSSHQRSADEGSPIQSFGWSFAAGDEDQDQTDRHADIEARGRSAKTRNGVVWFKQLRTFTPKDSPKFRTHSAMIKASDRWGSYLLLGHESPFVGPDHWERLRSVMSEREYARRVLAQDLPAELAVFYGWLRSRNLCPIPSIALDVTPAVLAPFRHPGKPGFSLLVGHDPGNIYNTSVVLRLLMFGDVPTWIVVGELQTKQKTAHQHAALLRDYLRKFHHFSPQYRAAVFCDPHGKGEAQTDYKTVYMAMMAEGLDVMNPAPMEGRIKVSARVEMTNRLFADAAGGTRLLVACDQRKQPMTPVLVEALETLQKRPGDEKPEGVRKKDEADMTHAPAALGYALWPFEQEHLIANTIRLALAEKRRQVG